MKKILLVDDHPSEFESMTMEFAKEGDDHTFETATSAQEAIAKLDGDGFDLIVTDLKMESQTAGMDVLREVRQRAPDVPVIMVTRYASLPDSREALRQGAFDFLDRSASGIDPDLMLRHKIKQALELREARSTRK